MTTPLLLQVRDEIFAALKRQADATGTRPEALGVHAIEDRYGTSPPSLVPLRREDDPFVRLIGSLPGAVPGGTDNDQIDKDLARACDAELEGS